MTLLAAHINDAGISVSDGDRIFYHEPGYALLEDDGLVTGRRAYASASLKPRRIHKHFWSHLTTDALVDQRFHHLSAADLVSRQLEEIWRSVASDGDQLALAVPAYMTHENLGLLLGIAMELRIPVVAMVDAAVCATRRRYEHAVPVHIDLSLHTCTLTRLAQEQRVQTDRAEVIDEAGVLALYDNWLQLIANAFVQQSRFDPLHTAETEQALQDQMPNWMAQAGRAGTVSMSVNYGDVSYTAELDSLEIVAAAAPVYQSIVSNLRALYRAEDTPAIQLSDRAALMPGLAETLKTRVGGEVYLLEAGATARGLAKRCPADASGGSVSLLRHLDWDQAPMQVVAENAGNSSGVPSHLLFGHRAIELGDAPLVLGSQAADGERWLDFDEQMPGMSRRHCVIAADNGQLVVTDHSRYGTFVNGHRIEGTAVLQTGDLIRVGTPGFELRLIRAEQIDGS